MLRLDIFQMLAICGFLRWSFRSCATSYLCALTRLSFPVLPFKQRPDSHRLPFSDFFVPWVWAGFSFGRCWQEPGGQKEGRSCGISSPLLTSGCLSSRGCFSSLCLAPTQDPCYPSFYQVMLGFWTLPFILCYRK